MLEDILAPLVSQAECHVKNLGRLEEMLAELQLEDEMLESQDVASIFTNILIEAALELIKFSCFKLGFDIFAVRMTLSLHCT